MVINVDSRKVLKVEVVPWEEEDGIYGVAWETSDGQRGADKIGSLKQAEAILSALNKMHGGEQTPEADVIPFPKDIAAS